MRLPALEETLLPLHAGEGLRDHRNSRQRPARRSMSSTATTGVRDKAGTIMYAMGWTQHTVGVQNIRTMSIIQLLLGNMGIAGGGVNALRGESNVQGSTDQALLFHILPGYLRMPVATQQSFEDYINSLHR